jgi:hypothetical protein
MIKLSPQEVNALALERILRGIDDLWLRMDGPMFEGLNEWEDPDSEVLLEIGRIRRRLADESAANPTPAMVWTVIVGDLPSYSWWHSIEILEGDLETPGVVEIECEDTDDGSGEKTLTKRLTASDLLRAYNALDIKTHCDGCHIIGDPDGCSADFIMQQACYGEIVFG